MPILKLTLLIALLSVASQAGADAKPFSQEKFDQLQADGKPVLIDVWADWCPTCKRQGTILGPLLQEEEFQNITLLKVDFDDQKDVVKAFGATRQSTLILYKNGKEVDRGVAETNPERLREFVGQLN